MYVYIYARFADFSKALFHKQQQRRYRLEFEYGRKKKPDQSDWCEDNIQIFTKIKLLINKEQISIKRLQRFKLQSV